MRYVAGIDGGQSSTAAVVVDEKGVVRGRGIANVHAPIMRAGGVCNDRAGRPRGSVTGPRMITAGDLEETLRF